VILVLLVVAATYTFLKRKESEPPKWMGRLQTATPRFALTLGLLLLGIFPTDIVTSFAVGSKLAREGAPWVQCLPFIGLTLLILGLPALLVVLLGKRAQVVLPKVRDWMNNNSWVVSELVIALFIGIEISSIAGS
jgi:Sap, sulfolipid-1-addressing protein